MKTKSKIITLALFGLMLSLTSVVMADRDYGDDDDSHDGFKRWFRSSKPVISSVESNFYADECGSCHFAYQPGLLPARSWKRIMAGLDDHFGENAELEEKELKSISSYLQQNSAGRIRQGLPDRITASLGDDNAPLRITETRFFLHEHDEIPSKMVVGNEQVRSFSNCDACHERVAQGSFREHEILIPGYGRWDD